ncbi:MULTISPECIES: TIGR02450 family Trp-rich protein [unclassified Pseudoalteromonas]|uniref:TIGR02450 family Trp-rich protein n=1 Tax=unclassified Pseudoalteromonas TaxID=194690 RepID=UPI000B3C3F91|nr:MULTISPECIES: TIGR02450 family Trp-rich protein [unclassified Pseudoalteromonas]MDN3379282.1 TIGR02450 family Trp-rich protein [Pseudoalteromonas sp. APC 3893]MDN3386456.1 TIGR02450 family Trp-rich protein [Pseudoalteromonas sp. APC 4017]OUS69546.1 hypothetical protein B5G52_16765 [Pseudoalteromonas sp. A601]
MNKVTPKKLLNSKWTAVSPINKDKHFMITVIEFDEEGHVIHCEIEALMSKRTQVIDWLQLKDQHIWLQGWK